MPRSRSLPLGLWLDYKLAQLSAWDRLLYLGMMNYADREGRLIDFPEEIGGYVFPYQPERPIEEGLQRLHDAGHIRRYVAGGQNLIQIVQWKKWQKPHGKEGPSVLPEYKASDVAPISSGKFGQVRAKPSGPGLGVGPIPVPIPGKGAGLLSGLGEGLQGEAPASEETATPTDDFETFMRRYPLMVDDDDFESAKQAWASLFDRGTIDGSSLPEILAGIETYDEAVMGTWPTPAFFLSHGGWKLAIQQGRAEAKRTSDEAAA